MRKKSCIKCKRKKLEHNFDILEIRGDKVIRSDVCKRCESEQDELYGE